MGSVSGDSQHRERGEGAGAGPCGSDPAAGAGSAPWAEEEGTDVGRGGPARGRPGAGLGPGALPSCPGHFPQARMKANPKPFAPAGSVRDRCVPRRLGSPGPVSQGWPAPAAGERLPRAGDTEPVPRGGAQPFPAIPGPGGLCDTAGSGAEREAFIWFCQFVLVLFAFLFGCCCWVLTYESVLFCFVFSL